MSEEKKDYEEYFRALERDINKPESAEKKPEKSIAPKKTAKRKRLSKKGIAVISVMLAVIVAAVVIIARPGTDKKPQPQKPVPVKAEKEKQPAYFIPPVPKRTNVRETDADIEAKSVLIINITDNEVVTDRASKERVFPASTTKIMTALVAAENIKNMQDTFVMTADITDPLYLQNATVAGFVPGEAVNMTDLLYGIILPSGADAAQGIAQKISGSEQEFVKLMNKKVKDLGLKDTHFENVSGLHAENHYTTAYDMAQILRAAMENELCKTILSSYQYTTAKTEQHPDGILLTSTLFSYMYGTEPAGAAILGGKTGYTEQAGYCIASFGKSDSGKEFICVSMGAPSKWPAMFGQIHLYERYAGGV